MITFLNTSGDSQESKAFLNFITPKFSEQPFFRTFLDFQIENSTQVFLEIVTA